MNQIYRSLGSAIADLYGQTVSICQWERICGGDINDAHRLHLSNGTSVFIKTNMIASLNFFVTERLGLQALRSTGAIGIPEVLAVGTDADRGISFLLMEYIPHSSKRKDYWEMFGHQLAKMHRADLSYFLQDKMDMPQYGFPEDNYIGANPQKNTPKESWIEFYRDCRLAPQIAMAERWFSEKMRKQFRYLLDHLESYLCEPEFPSLLHGDLWSGNVICGKDGRAWILDPAAYIGHFEADLAMTQLFGGFPASFYGAYHESNPIDREYEQRKDLYQLYHLLNHLNLFGSSYLGSVMAILDHYSS